MCCIYTVTQEIAFNVPYGQWEKKENTTKGGKQYWIQKASTGRKL